ncbi:MAG: XisH family protein [Phormidesmis sp. CAN_BIN44]|nr:XisH family protein [Phormidesmis sp. CAN_BIN44]
MPARDIYHDTVKNALLKDGWTITHDPYRLKLARGKNLFIDLGAERLIAAERGIEKIVVEVKSFRSESEMRDLEDALGQFVLYEHLLTRYDPDRTLYLAVPDAVRQSVFEEEAGTVLIEDEVIRLFTFNPIQEVIVKWIPQTST